MNHFAHVCTFKDTAYNIEASDNNLTNTNDFVDMSALIAHADLPTSKMGRGRFLEKKQ